MNTSSIASRLKPGCFIHFDLSNQCIFITEGQNLLLPMPWPTKNDSYTCLLIENRDDCFQLAGLIAGISGYLIGEGEETSYGIRYRIVESNA